MYWTLDNRPPTLDERIIQAKARHAERVEQIAAEEPVPQLEVLHSPYGGTRLATQAECEPGTIGPTFTVRPGYYFEVSEEQMRAYHERQQRLHLQHLASLQNMGMSSTRYGLGLSADPNPWAAAQQGFAHHPFLRF